MKKIETEKLNKLMNRKVLLGVFSILMCGALIGICSFSAFIIDPTRWQTKEFLTDELIIIAIVIMSMVSVMFIGQASNAQNEKSRLAKARVAFFEKKKEIDQRGISAFRQWIRKVLQPEDIRIIKERKIRNLGIDDFSVVDLEYNEIRSLKETPQKYNGRFYKGLSKEQIKGIIEIKENKKPIKFVEPEYYLSVKNLIDTRTISERASNEGKKKGGFLTLNILGRVGVTLVSAMIFASLVRDMSADVDAATAWAKFASRMWAMISSAFMGFLVGTQINDIDAEYIEMRIEVHTRFLEDKTFKALSQQEEAKQEFVDRVKEEQVLKLDNKQSQIEMKQ